jgi:hypothetical protein
MRKSSKLSFAEFRAQGARPRFNNVILCTLFNSMYEIDLNDFPDCIFKYYIFN